MAHTKEAQEEESGERLSEKDLELLFGSKEQLDKVDASMQDGDVICVVGGTASRFLIDTLEKYEVRGDIDIITGDENLKERLNALDIKDENIPELDVIDYREYLPLYMDALNSAMEELRKSLPGDNGAISFYEAQYQSVKKLLEQENIDTYLITAFLFKRESVGIKVTKKNGILVAEPIDNVYWKNPLESVLDIDVGIHGLYKEDETTLGEINPLSIKLLLLMIATELPEGTVINNPIMHSALDVPPRIIKEMAEGSFKTRLYGDSADPLRYVYEALQLFMKDKFPFKSGKGYEYERSLFKRKFQENISIGCAQAPAEALYHAIGVFSTGDMLIPGLSEEFANWHKYMGGSNLLKEILNMAMSDDENLELSDLQEKLGYVKEEVINLVSLFMIQEEVLDEPLNSMSEIFAMLLVAFNMDGDSMEGTVDRIVNNWTQTDESIEFWSEESRMFDSSVSVDKIIKAVRILREQVDIGRLRYEESKDLKE